MRWLFILFVCLSCGNWAYESDEECFDGLDNDCDGKVDLAESNCSLDCRKECCKICDDSKPCGDSCIPKTSECNTYSGCACRESDLCTDDDYPIEVEDPYAECCTDKDGEWTMCEDE